MCVRVVASQVAELGPWGVPVCLVQMFIEDFSTGAGLKIQADTIFSGAHSLVGCM